jgi:hypothetical protein
MSSRRFKQEKVGRSQFLPRVQLVMAPRFARLLEVEDRSAAWGKKVGGAWLRMKSRAHEENSQNNLVLDSRCSNVVDLSLLFDQNLTTFGLIASTSRGHDRSRTLSVPKQRKNDLFCILHGVTYAGLEIQKVCRSIGSSLT